MNSIIDQVNETPFTLLRGNLKISSVSAFRLLILFRLEKRSFLNLNENALCPSVRGKYFFFKNDDVIIIMIYTECKYGGPLGRRPERVA